MAFQEALAIIIPLCLLALLALVPVILCIGGLVYRWRAGVCTSKASMVGKTVIITGSSAGIGKEAARDIAKRGARVILACRNVDKANTIKDDIEVTTGCKNVVVMQLDTSDLNSVRNFAAKVLQTENRLDVLIVNAGVGGLCKLKLTSDNLETTMATNHFGHFLLTNLLLDLLKKTVSSRVVVTASGAHAYCKSFNPQFLTFENGGFSSFSSYCQSKLCNILFVRHLAHLVKDYGITVNALCPGLVKTEIFEKSEGWLMTLNRVLLSHIISKNEVQGAQTIIHLAVAEEVRDVTGEFFEDCKISTGSATSNDLDLARQLWETSSSLVKLGTHEKFY